MTSSYLLEPLWDVVVVGAGPAGCSAAASVLTTDAQARVLLIDQADFPRDKPCGDGIAAEVDVALGELGFDVGRIYRDTPPVGRLRLRSPAGVEVDRAHPAAVHVVAREVFDARLVADLRGRGVELRRETLRSVEVGPTEVAINGRLRARVVIGADGAGSRVRRSLGLPVNPAGRVALAIRGYAPEPPGQAGTQVITMTRQHWPAYAWSFPLGDGRANVGYGELLGDRPLDRAHLIARMRELLPGLETEPDRLRAHKLPLSSGRPRIPDGRVLLAGDAQSLINPLTGEGIFYAVTSGALAGRAAVESLTGVGDPGQIYRRMMRVRLGRHLRHTTALARLGRWPGLVDAGLRAGAADQSAFDDLVRFGLADGLLTARLLTRLRL